MLENLTRFAHRVEELTLRDAPNDKYHKVSDDIIIRLGMVLGAKASALLPSLKRLRLVNANSELVYLWFCVTPSIETVEVVEIPTSRLTAISAFFRELRLTQAHQLAGVVLGPGKLSTDIFESVVQFTHLRRLEILDAAKTVDFSFLQATSVLHHLEVFIIDAYTATYTPYGPATTISPEPASHPNDLPASGPTEDLGVVHQLSDDLNEQPIVSFPGLTTLTVTGDVTIICDLIHHLFPRRIEHISLTLVYKSMVTHSNVSLFRCTRNQGLTQIPQSNAPRHCQGVLGVLVRGIGRRETPTCVQIASKSNVND